ncbi:MAG TPA: alpha-hydroxy-acid oxidizing protein [Spirochaetota bacterium]|nr:alpha-hydroxy-acid oxidizing protein [Spirochaetota bacterium]HOS32215.1 alpha-hydroxy-acid oxidizing protein [Spirochaetota bacterium]HOS55640.1 alpha-hydroxy-acid oxidizing protein [Spirochaetota bacterium]HPK60913.1 alpha-hydroxy-acid oxidizing protein [Spirochaetota bacterium]HQF78164.1 alpha-hydroxy-acid oxidizing protein [Spirochaetota bacterium]
MNDYHGKTILIIGAGLLQVPAIKTANSMGLTTVVTDYNKEAPGMKIADFPVVVSTRDIEGTVRVVKEFNNGRKIDGAITVGTDASMTVSAVANALGLPGIKYENAIAASNKIKMRERFREHNVAIPDFYKCWSFEDLKKASSLLGYPFVLKPADNMGARGVMKVESEANLENAFLNAKNGSPSGELIAEEYMDGPELSIDALIYDGEIFITGVADRIIEREPYFIETGHVLPSALPEEELNEGIEVFKKGIRALGIDIGAAKGDIKITKNGAKVGEIAARLSGGFMSAYTFPYATGINVIRNALDIALGYPPSSLVPTKKCFSIEQAIIPSPGIVKEILGVEEALAIEGVKNIFFHVKEGDEVVIPKSNVEKAGNFIVVRDTREEAWEVVRKVHKIINVVTTPKMDKVSWEEIRRGAREKFNRACFVCNICNGEECRGKVPGIGGIGNGDSFVRNFEDLRKVRIITKSIHDIKEADTEIDIFGIHLALPLIAAPIAGTDINLGGKISELEYGSELLAGCKDSGIIGLLGDGAPQNLYKIGVEAIKSADGHGGLIIKPRIDEKELNKRIDESNEINAKLFGMDVDGISMPTMDIHKQGVEPKTIVQLKKIIDKISVPFIIKGVMSVEDAESAVVAGASAIVVSNHGGRITENHPSSISVLENISKAVKGKIKVLFDGGVRSGEDIFKAIALGADAVLIGRPFATAVMGGGRDGVKILIDRYLKELKKIMILTGIKNINSITRDRVVCRF